MKTSNNYTDLIGRQSYVSKSGRSWEIYVMNFLNAHFKKKRSNIAVLAGKNIRGTKLWQSLAIPVRYGKREYKVEGDVDLVVINKNRSDKPLAVISCKTSLHGRFSETLFYSIVWKQQIPRIVVIFATPDKGRQAKKRRWESEWGTENKPTKARLLAEKYLDGVYIGNVRTYLSGKIKPLKDLPEDLEKLVGR
jgi:hypothetical protein